MFTRKLCSLALIIVFTACTNATPKTTPLDEAKKQGTTQSEVEDTSSSTTTETATETQTEQHKKAVAEKVKANLLEAGLTEAQVTVALGKMNASVSDYSLKLTATTLEQLLSIMGKAIVSSLGDLSLTDKTVLKKAIIGVDKAFLEYVADKAESPDKVISIGRLVAEALTSKLKDAKVAAEDLADLMKEKTKTAIEALEKSDVSLDQLLKEATSAATSGLLGAGFTGEEVGNASKSIASGALEGALKVGCTDAQLGDVATELANGIISTLKDNGVDTAIISSAASNVLAGIQEAATAANVSTTVISQVIEQVSSSDVLKNNNSTPTNVIYDGNGNTGGSVPIDSTSYESGQTITVLGNSGNLIRTSYSFSGWNTLSNGSGTTYTQSQTFTMGSANVTLYAKWTANPTYRITYDGNGNTDGSVPTDSTNFESGQTITVLGNSENLVKTGYAFSAWNTQANGSGTSYTQSQTFTMGSADVTFYAKWTANPIYNVTYDGNGNTGGSIPTDSTSYESGQTVTVLGNSGNLVKAGYSLSGWNTLSNGSGTTYTQSQTFTMGSANIILYAKWTANPIYSVTYNGNFNTGGNVPTDSTGYESGQTVTVLGNGGNLVSTGYSFSGWNTLSNGSGTTYTQSQTFTMGSANVTLYAKWTANPTYDVTYDGNGNTGGSVPTDSTSYESGQTVTALGNSGNLVRTGYSFLGWNTLFNGSGTTYTQSQTFTMGSADVTLYAKWTANVFAAGISINSSDVEVPVYWLNGTRMNLTPIDATKSAGVYSIAISGSNVYVAGYSANSSNVGVPGYWLNGTWTALTPINATKNSQVYSIAISESNVYAAGYSTNNSNVWVPVYWLNGARTNLTPIDATKRSEVKSIAVSGSNVYAAGYSTNNSNVLVPGYWLNGTWTALTPINATKSAEVNSIAISESNVYAAGCSINSSNVKVAGYWLNDSWTALATESSMVNSIAISGSNVYAAGYIINSSNGWIPVYWLNGTRTNLSSIDATEQPTVNSIAISGSNVYAAGFVDSSNVAVPGYWLNGTWTALTPIDATKNAVVNSIAIFQ